ncbi:hypothetical protein F2Q69_00024931 [Brassica cretica]|uniref:threonine--tRNA ligase n=1 Tax=Brassica cretica TaxID=69181 RepID=A0A8S9QC24_BRACR|nr:hypothetical protein F2Q69_00024931 [Brassica cretica]
MQALEQEYGCKLCIGPCTTKGEEAQHFERIEVTKDQALEMFSDNNFKASSAYWKGSKDPKNPVSLQRVYGISYPDQKQLKKYLQFLEEAKKYDHRILGQKQELFFCHPLRERKALHARAAAAVRPARLGSRVITPNMYNIKLWDTSGHAEKYKKNTFTFDIEKQEFGLKPMNCPGHCLMFQHRVRSYRELPIRLADFGVLHRNEESGALSGLTVPASISLDDAHIFCTEDQVMDEVKAVLDFIDYAYKIFGFTYELKLSTRPGNYLGDLKTWDKAENDLKLALDAFGRKWQLSKGDGAFYGPKIDITVSDAMNRKFQCATLQYSDEDEGKKEKPRPVMIHRAVLGSVERMFAILLEHYKGKWPFWLSPRQSIVCPISKKSEECELVVGEIEAATG